MELTIGVGAGGTLYAGGGAVKCGSYSGDFEISNTSSNWVSQTIGTDLPVGTVINASTYAGTHDNSYYHEVGVYFFDANWNWISGASVEVNKVLANSPAGPQLYTWTAIVPVGTKYTQVGYSGNGSWIKTDQWCVTLASGTTVAFGNQLFVDLNGNGKKDGSDWGYDGVTVKLYADANEDGVADGAALATTATSGGGFYNFANLVAGKYLAQIENAPSWMYVIPKNGGDPDNNIDDDNNGLSQSGTTIKGGTITLSVGGEPGSSSYNSTYDFAVYKTNGLGDYVFLDANANGIQDAGEGGISGVTVKLRNSSGTVLATTTTDANGYYYFYDPAQYGTYNYQLQFVTPVGYSPSPANQGSDDNKDSDPVSGIIPTFTVADGTWNNSFDAGFYLPIVNLGDKVWYDLNNNGVLDGLETGISGVTVNLYKDASGDNIPDGAAIATTTTNATGNYSFSNLAPGNYIVGAVIPANYTASATAATSSNPNNDTNNDNNGINITAGEVRTNYITLSDGAEPTNDGDNSNGNLTLDIGLKALQYIGDYVWYDLNQNGIQDGDAFNGEYGVSGVKVELYNSSNVLLQTTNTNKGGFYYFVVAPGNYYVKFSNMPNEFTLTNQGVGSTSTDSDPNPATGITNNFTVTSGVNNTTIDAGLRSKAGVGNFVWVDANANGRQDAGEQGVSGIFVGLYSTSNVLVGASITDNTGYYFINTIPGTYYLKINLPSGYNLTSQNASGVPTNLNSDANVITGQTNNFTLVSSIDNDWDFGLVLKPNTQVVCGQIPLKSTEITSNISIAKFVPSNFGTLSNVAIDYSALTLNPIIGIENTGNGGTADLVTTSLATLTLPNATSLVVNNGFINPTVTLGTYDGLTDYRGTSGWNKVNNIKANSSSINNYTAASDFLWTSGNTTVALPFSTNNTASFNATGGNNDFLIRTMSSAGACISYTYITSNLGNFVWVDNNGNGIQDAGEPGFAGVTVNLKNTTGTILATTTTDANGAYLFTNLGQYPSNIFVVEFATPSGYTLSPKDLGSNDETDSDPSPSSIPGFNSLFVQVPSGTSNLTIDAGFRPNVLNIGNRVWNDVNRNGILDAGENGIAGVNVSLYRDDNFDGTAENSGNYIATINTDVNGFYNFTNLAPGGYIVKVTAPVGFIATILPSTGANANNDVDDDNNGSFTNADGIRSNTVALTIGGEPTTDGDGNNGNLTVDFGLYNPYSLCNNSLIIDNFSTITDIIPTASRPKPTNISGSYTNAGSVGGFMTTTLLGNNSSTVISNTYIGASTEGPGYFTVNTAAGDSISTRMIWDGDTNPALNPTGMTCKNLSPYESIDFIYEGDRSAGTNITFELTLYSGAGNASRVTINHPSGGNSFPTFVSIPFSSLTALAGFNPVNLSCVTAISLKADILTATHNNGWDYAIQQIVACSKVAYASLGDKVWLDTNNDGIQDAGEPGISGVAVTLTKPDGSTVSTTTDANGAYQFTNLIPGTYSVSFATPSGYKPTTSNAGSNDALDSDPINGVVTGITLTAGQSNQTIDAGFRRLINLSGNVWHDVNALTDNLVNNSGALQTPPSQQIPNLYAYLVNANTGLVEQVVDVDPFTNSYSFNDVSANTNYLVIVTTAFQVIGGQAPASILPSGWTNTGQQLGLSPGSDGLNDGILEISVGTTDVINANFGIRKRGSNIVTG